MTTWNCINRAYALDAHEHYVFVDGAGRVALADHTIVDFSNPASGEDGLMLWNDKVGEFQQMHGEGLAIKVSVVLDDGYVTSLWIAPEVAKSIENATGKKVAPATFKVGPFEYHRSRPAPFDEAEFIAEARRWVEESTRS